MPASDWLDLCPQTVVWQALVSRDQFGKPSYGAPQTFRGRRVRQRSRVAAFSRGVKGEGSDAINETVIWILGTPDIGYEDLVYVDGEDATKQPPILNVEKVPDETGDLFVKVTLGSFNG